VELELSVRWVRTFTETAWGGKETVRCDKGCKGGFRTGRRRRRLRWDTSEPSWLEGWGRSCT